MNYNLRKKITLPNTNKKLLRQEINYNLDNYFKKLDNYLVTEVLKDEPKKETGCGEFYCKNCEEHTMTKEELGYECYKCGRVGNKIIDQGAEWRYYGINDTRGYNPTRTGNIINPLLPKSSMGTFIGGGSKYSNIYRLHTWQSMPPSERSLWMIYKKINRLLQNSDIANKIIEESKYYYKIITENDKKLKGILTRGSIREGLIAACIYISCKNNGVPKHSMEIAKLCNIDENLVTKGLKRFVEIEKRKKLNINNKQSKPSEFINIYCNKLNLSNDIKYFALVLCERIIKLGILKNNTPPSVAGGIIYLVIMKLRLNISKSTLVGNKDNKKNSVIKISEVTLNKTYKKLLNYSDFIFIGFEKFFDE